MEKFICAFKPTLNIFEAARLVSITVSAVIGPGPSRWVKSAGSRCCSWESVEGTFFPASELVSSVVDGVLAVSESTVDIGREAIDSPGVVVKLVILVSVEGGLDGEDDLGDSNFDSDFDSDSDFDFAFDFAFFAFDFFLDDSEGMAFRSSAGISVKPVAKVPRLPIIAAAPPVIGSLGPGSVSYSLGRYLKSARY